jgi:hypothetical protein
MWWQRKDHFLPVTVRNCPLTKYTLPPSSLYMHTALRGTPEARKAVGSSGDWDILQPCALFQKTNKKLGVVRAYNPSTQEAEKGESRVQASLN